MKKLNELLARFIVSLEVRDVTNPTQIRNEDLGASPEPVTILLPPSSHRPCSSRMYIQLNTAYISGRVGLPRAVIKRKKRERNKIEEEKKNDQSVKDSLYSCVCVCEHDMPPADEGSR